MVRIREGNFVTTDAIIIVRHHSSCHNWHGCTLFFTPTYYLTHYRHAHWQQLRTKAIDKKKIIWGAYKTPVTLWPRDQIMLPMLTAVWNDKGGSV